MVVTMEKRAYSFIDRAFLLFLFVIPFMPMPTMEGWPRLIAPVASAALLYLFILWFLMSRSFSFQKNPQVGALIILSVIIVALYFLRIAMNGEWEEASRLVSKALFYFTIAAFFVWMAGREIPLKTAFKPFFYGVVILSLLIIFSGITGFAPLETVRPGRTYGITLPFYKVSFIPRSFGELGIFLTAAWAYFLSYRKDYGLATRLFFGVALFLAVVITQSRNTYLAVVVATAVYIMLRTKVTNRAVAVVILAAWLMPFIISVIPRDIPVFSALVGEGTWERNVNVRLMSYSAAVDMITESPGRFLLGIPHSVWVNHFSELEGVDATMHNHFLSSIMFLGFIGGILDILVLMIPVARLLKRPDYRDKDVSLLLTMTAGALTCLNFYEGFYSTVLAFEIGALWYSYSLIKVRDVERVVR